MIESVAGKIIPENDDERLKALHHYRILYSLAEDAFDNITQMMARVFDMPMSFISLVDKDTVFYKSQVGSFGKDHVSRNDSFCSYTILRNDPLIIEDALLDDGLSGNPYVAAESGMRFYAGAPLITSDGFHIGTACVMDIKPGHFSEKQKELLVRFAKMVMHEMEMHLVVVKQEQFEEQILASNRELQFVTDTMPQLVWATEASGYSSFFNKGWLEYTGLSFDEVKGDGWTQSLHPDDWERTFAAWTQAVQTGGAYDVEYRLKRHDGVYRWFVARGVPMKDSNGTILKWYGTTTDIEAQKKAEKALQRSHERFGLVAKATQDAIWDWNLLTNDLWWNDGFKELFGYSDEEIEPTVISWYNRVHPDDKDRVVGGIHRIIDNGGKNWSAEYRFRRKDGSYAIVFDRGYALHDDDGKPYRMLGSMQDITEQKKNEERLIQKDKNLRQLMYQAPVAMAFLKGNNLVLEIVNRDMLLLIDKTEDIIGKPLLTAMPEMAGQPIIDIIRNVLLTGEAFYGNEVLVPLLHNGVWENRYFNFAYTPVIEEEKVIGVFNVATEVTEQVCARKKIEQSEQRFQGAVAAVQGVLWTNSAEGKMEGEQPGWSALTGQTYDEYKEYGWSAVVHPEDAQPTIDAWHEAVRDRRMFLFEHRLKIKSGQWRLFAIRAIPLFDAEGAIIEWVGVHTDITEQREAEEKVRQSELRFQTLVKEASVGIIILTGPEMNVEVVNDAYGRLIGKNTDDLLHKKLFDIIPEAEAVFRPIIDGVRTTGEPLYLFDQPYMVLADGNKIEGFLNLVYQPYRQDGVTSGVMVLCHDVTAQVTARRKVEEAEKTVRLAVEAAELGTFNVNLLTDEIIASARLNEIFDVEPASERSRFIEALHTDDLPVRAAAYENAAQIGLLEYEARVVTKAGSVRWIRVRGQMTFDETNQATQLVGVVQEITEQKEFENELRKQVKERTLELEQFTFVSHHDLQEPLRKISMFSDMLHSESFHLLPEPSQKKLTKIIEATKRMSAALRDALNYARLNQEEQFVDVDLGEVFSAVCNDLELLIMEKEATIQADILPVSRAIPQQMHQLFYNLLNNSLKFSKAGEKPLIQLSCQVLHPLDKVNYPELDPGKNYHHLVFRDNGIGFDQKQAEKIFIMFQRLHNQAAYAGTGIGLALARKVVSNHDGLIWAESRPGEGAAFHILLPVAK